MTFNVFDPVKRIVSTALLSAAPIAIFTALGGGLAGIWAFLKRHIMIDWLSQYVPDFSWVSGLLDSTFGQFLGFVFALDFIAPILDKFFTSLPVLITGAIIVLVMLWNCAVTFLIAKLLLSLTASIVK